MIGNGKFQVRELRRFLARAVKAPVPPSPAALLPYIDAVPVKELEKYWSDLHARLALRAAQALPDYQMRERKVAFADAQDRYALHAVPGMGSAEALRSHLCRVLIETVREEQELDARFRTEPWFVRLHARWAQAIVVVAFLAVPLMILGGFFHAWLPKGLPHVDGNQVMVWVCIVWGAFLISGMALVAWQNRKRKSGG
jgi:hypothetical protein